MGLLFAWALMGLPLVYAIWSLVQERNQAQIARHAPMQATTNISPSPTPDRSLSQADMRRTDAVTASSPLASQPANSFIDQLATLQTRLIDVLAGYRTMQEKAEPEIQPIVHDYIDTHVRHEHALAERLTELGHQPDEDGSFFSIVQESVVRVRSIFTNLDANTIPQITDGENTLVDLYQKTLEQADLETDQALLQRQMQELSDLIRRSEALTT